MGPCKAQGFGSKTCALEGLGSRVKGFGLGFKGGVGLGLGIYKVYKVERAFCLRCMGDLHWSTPNDPESIV